MYVTRPLSMYINQPSALSLPPPEGPNSGILVLQDEEAELTCCFGLYKSNEILDLPFPQNKNLTLRYSTGNNDAYHFYASFVPVLNLPLSSNRYYVIQTRGRHKGEAYTNSSEEDMKSCCFCNIISDVPPQPLDHNNTYQQFEVMRVQGRLFNQTGQFTARSVAQDGVPPRFLERKGWEASTSSRHGFDLGEAPGLNASLRARLPGFDFPLSYKTSDSVIVGKWYCPFMFIREGRVKDQVRNSPYYEMTLEQNWEKISECENKACYSVAVDVSVKTMRVSISGKEVKEDEQHVADDGFMWFRIRSHGNGEKEGSSSSVGLSMAIVERMKWEEERAGYVWGNNDEERHVRVKKEDHYEVEGWKNYGCYVLVERFVLRRMDGSLVLTCEFKHTHHIRSKWD